MDNPGYVTITRQSGLARELSAIANNLANMSTTGYRAERVLFSEHVKGVESPIGSMSMGTANPRFLDTAQGGLTVTRGVYDFAIEGDGYFTIDTPDGQRLTRAGSFALSPEGSLVNMDGFPLLDAAGGPVFIPPGAGEIAVGADGSISIDGEAVGQIGLVTVDDPKALRHDGGTMLVALEPVQPVTNARIAQGFLENANVNPVVEISRMIEVQRAYELSASLAKNEDDRIRQSVRKLGEAI
jgi:flagellar basal-body rod protein FlgF